jgi:hypothetical protein
VRVVRAGNFNPNSFRRIELGYVGRDLRAGPPMPVIEMYEEINRSAADAWAVWTFKVKREVKMRP